MSLETKSNVYPSARPSHVAIGAQCNDHSAFLAGVPAKQFFTDAATFARVQLLITEYYQLDVLSNFWDVYNIEAEALGQKIIYPSNGIPDVDRTRYLISTPGDLDRLSAPDPYRSGRMPWIRQFSRFFGEETGSVERVYFTAPFSAAVNIRGYENLVLDIYERPRFVHRLLAFLCDDVIAPFMEVMRSEIGNPGLIMDGRDAWASPPMLSLDMMDEYVVAYTERLRNRLGDKLITRGNWGDAKVGDVEGFWERKLRCSPGCLSVLDPDLHTIGPERVKIFANKHHAATAAGVDATLLQRGPVEAIVKRIKLYIDQMARDGRCMLHLNQIPADTPPEHIHAAVAACHTYGRHPIPDNLADIHFEIPQRESFAEFMRNKGEFINIS